MTLRPHDSSDGQGERNNDILTGVDRAALIFAATASAVTLLTAAGDWSAASSFLGLLLVVLVLAFHRPAPRNGSPRSGLIRCAFGFTLSLSLMILIAWPVQYANRQLLDEWWFVLLILLGGGGLLAAIEPTLVRFLDQQIIKTR